MILTSSDRIFDTLIDTKQIYVAMKNYFIIRPYDNNPNKALVYLVVTGSSQRERISLGITVDVKDWDESKKRFTGKNKELQDKNLVLDNIEAKITGIKTVFWLNEKLLTPSILKSELKDATPRVDFISFWKKALKEIEFSIEPGTYRKYKSAFNKVSSWRKEIIFTDIDHKWFEDFKNHFRSKGNNQVTINSNINCIKKFLRMALKAGIKIKIDLDDIKVGSTSGNRSSLTALEIKKFIEYYETSFIKENDKLIVGYFLIGCMTGMRIGTIQKISRENFTDEYVSFISNKSKKDQSISLNFVARKILNECDKLFVKRFTDQFINRELKKIAIFLGIKTNITFHVSRHTFATSFIRAGGSVEKLQLLLGHSNIKETMIYVKIVASEANKDIFLLDDFLK